MRSPSVRAAALEGGATGHITDIEAWSCSPR
jgi:hypothetical protein